MEERLKLPEWVRSIDAAVWIVDPDGRFLHVNDQARELLGIARGEERERPCHAVVRGLDETGAPICTEACRPRAGAAASEPLRPFLLRRDAAWILVLPVTSGAGDALELVHVAIPMSRYRRTAEYWEHVLQGSFASPDEAPSPPARVLSAREREVLARLARGDDLKRIARELFVSYATVRNHVQHILEKLHVHSKEEAVALHLLLGENGDGGSASRSGDHQA